MDKGELGRKLIENEEAARKAAEERLEAETKTHEKAEKNRDIIRREIAVRDHIARMIEAVGERGDYVRLFHDNVHRVTTSSNGIDLGPLDVSDSKGRNTGYAVVFLEREGEARRRAILGTDRKVEKLKRDAPVTSVGIRLYAGEPDEINVIEVASFSVDNLDEHVRELDDSSDISLSQLQIPQRSQDSLGEIESALPELFQAAGIDVVTIQP